MWSKMSLMGSIWSKYVILGENGQNWVILGAKMTSYVEIWESIEIIFSLKVSKNYFHQVYGTKCGQTCN